MFMFSLFVGKDKKYPVFFQKKTKIFSTFLCAIVRMCDNFAFNLIINTGL